LLLALPAMRLFRQAFCRSPLSLMGRPERLSLVAFDLQAHSVHSMDQSGMAYFYLEGEPLPAGLFAFFASFAVVLAFGKLGKNLLVENLQRTGAEKVIRLPSFPPEGLKVHAADYLVNSLRACGFEGQNLFSPLRLPKDAREFPGVFLRSLGFKEGDRLLAIHPGSGNPAKNWSAENFARVADGMSNRAKILLLSGPAKDGVEEVRKAMKKADFFPGDQLPLIQLAALLQTSTAYLGNDSGITHLAAALGIPTVAIFGPTDPATWGPRGQGVQILSARSSCSLCTSETRFRCSRQCLERIKPDRVIEVLSPFFA
jgi:ADP-heptose:LPS heptosyltransferase